LHKLKFLACLILFPLIVVPTASGQFFDTPGLHQEFEIGTGGYNFSVEITSTFNVEEVEFSQEDKKLTLFISSGIKHNLGEIQIPTNLINGNFTFFLNEQEFYPKVKTSERISFITVEFQGDGKNKLEIIGTTYLPEFSEIAPIVLASSIFGLILIKRLKNFQLLIK